MRAHCPNLHPEPSTPSRRRAVVLLTAALMAGALGASWLASFSASAEHPSPRPAAAAQVTDGSDRLVQGQSAAAAAPDLSGAANRAAALSSISQDIYDASIADQLATDDVLGQKRSDQAVLDERSETVHAELGMLTADVAALRDRLSTLDSAIDGQEALLIQISWRQDGLARRHTDVIDQMRATTKEIRLLKEQLTQRAISAYMTSVDSSSDELAEAVTHGQDDTKLALIDSVAESDAALIIRLERQQARLTIQELEISELVAEAAAQRELEIATNAAMALNRGEVEALTATLQARIVDFSDEAEALEAERKEVNRIIGEREAAIRSGAVSEPEDDRAETVAPPSLSVAPLTSVQWPAAGRVSSNFGPRWGRTHQGMDIAAPTGDPIVAAAAGEVYHVGRIGGYGIAVLIDHGGGMHTLYAHQSEALVSVGEIVEQGELIGLIGSTGNSTGPHLHFEIQVDGVAVDPADFLFAS